MTLGYKITVLRGYTFEKRPSPFESFVTDLYSSRQEAKKAGNEPMSYLYKLVLNAAYGRLGIHPESEVLEICTEARYKEFIMNDLGLKDAYKISDTCYLVKFVKNRNDCPDERWEPPRYSAVHLSASITAYARIVMHPHVARNDCFYSDTDSIIIREPLPKDLVSPTELGLFKFEYKIKKGTSDSDVLALAPKSYALHLENETFILRHKGPAKAHVTFRWFERQLQDLNLTLPFTIRSGSSGLAIRKVETKVSLRIIPGTKRDLVYDEQNRWIATKPKKVIDMDDANHTERIIKHIEERAHKSTQLLQEERRTSDSELI